jgi:hypothetical protein
MRHEKMCHKACDFQWRGFLLLEKLNSQLSSEAGSYYLGDHAAGVCDPDDAQQRDPR